ncbi:MAG: hypothetical protein WBW41_17155 [Verrucomicrobiia bacterium]
MSWHRLRNVWLVWLASTLMVVLCPENVLHAADLVLASSPLSNAITASLEYQETDHSVINWGVSLTTQTIPFKKEPPAASGKIVRGVLNFGADSSNSISFIWQRDAGKLFLDLNRNQDLTDDPEGAFSARVFRPTSYQTFTNVHLRFNTAAGSCRALADISFWSFGSRLGCSAAIRSFWQGKATLQGRDWQVGIIQNGLSQSGSFENGQLLLRPWEKRNQSFNTYDGSLVTVPYSRKLFVDGHAYQLEWAARSQNGEVKPALQFTEQSIALGELKITGKFIQRLVLPGGPYLVVLDQPAASVRVPTGSYNQPDLRLEQNGAEAFCNSGQSHTGRRVSVDDKTPAVLDVGGPLTNSVTASRHGQNLRLDYRLVGAGGEIYQLANQDRSQPPEFAIYKGDKKVASGKFQFG